MWCIVCEYDPDYPGIVEARDNGGPGQGLLAHSHTEHAGQLNPLLVRAQYPGRYRNV